MIIMEWFVNSSIVNTDGFILHMVVAGVLGGIVGLERQWSRHQAGILTTLIVSLGSYAFTAFGYLLSDASVDLTRIAAQVVSGIGFLGAGVILREGGNVRGLNTAATVWASASIGILCCLNNLTYACLIAASIILFHLILHPVSDFLAQKRKYEKSEKKKNVETYYKISVSCPEEYELEIRKSIMSIIKNEPDALLHNMESTNDTDQKGTKKIRAYITTKKDNDALIESIIMKVGKNEDIISAGWKIDE